MFLLVTDVIWELAETFYENHRTLAGSTGLIALMAAAHGRGCAGGSFFFRFLDFSPFKIVVILSHIFLSQEESTSKHLLLDDRSEWRRIISTIINIAPRDAYNNIRLDTNTQTHKFQGMYITSYDMTQIKI